MRTCFQPRFIGRAFGIGLLLVAPAVSATAARLDAAAALEASEAAIGRQVDDHALVAADGSGLTMAEFRGRPLVLSLIYTRCSSVCPVTTQSVKSAVARARQALGADSFAVLTVGFDARHDTPARLAAFASDQGIGGDPLWHVASADAATLERLLRDIGFSYSGAAGGYEHAAQTTILDAEGRVSRHVYGDKFPIQVFMEPLKGLVFGTETRSFSISDLADRVRFLCTVYDPATGSYRTDYAIFFGIALGGLSLMLMGWLIVRIVRASRYHPEPRSRY